MNKESLLFHPAIFKGGHIAVLDETLLPFDVKYIKVKNIKNALSVLKEMKTRAFGQVLLFYYILILEAKNKKISALNKLLPLLEDITKKFISARPTFAFDQLKNELINMLKISKNNNFITGLENTTFNYIESIQNARRYRAKLAAQIIPQNARILTICNISGELVTVALEAEKLGKHVEFFAAETRPYFQGARLTTWELNRSNISAYLFCDIQAADILKRCRIDIILTGADRVSLKGDIVNKTGTYQLAVLAKNFHIPFYCFVHPPGETKSIKNIKIEYRPKEEMLAFHGRRLASKKQDALYPAFDVVPNELISGLIFFDGIYTPQEFAKKWKR